MPRTRRHLFWMLQPKLLLQAQAAGPLEESIAQPCYLYMKVFFSIIQIHVQRTQCFTVRTGMLISQYRRVRSSCLTQEAVRSQPRAHPDRRRCPIPKHGGVVSLGGSGGCLPRAARRPRDDGRAVSPAVRVQHVAQLDRTFRGGVRCAG